MAKFVNSQIGSKLAGGITNTIKDTPLSARASEVNDEIINSQIGSTVRGDVINTISNSGLNERESGPRSPIKTIWGLMPGLNILMQIVDRIYRLFTH